MRKRWWQLIIIGLMMSSLFNNAGTRLLEAADAPQLYLHRGIVTVGDGKTAVLSPAPLPNIHIIQLSGPVRPQDRAALEQSGLILLEYIPDYAFLVKATPTQLNHALNQPNILGSLPFTTADKLSPELLNTLTSAQPML